MDVRDRSQSIRTGRGGFKISGKRYGIGYRVQGFRTKLRF